MKPLEIARKRGKEICCSNCNKRVVIDNTNYCEVSGKIILEIHLDTRRKECKFERR